MWQGEKVSISHTEILVFFSGSLDHWDSVLLLLGDESSCWHHTIKPVSPSLTLISVLWSPLLNGSLLNNCWYCTYPWGRTVIYCWSLGKVVCSTVVSCRVTSHPCDILLVSSKKHHQLLPTSLCEHGPCHSLLLFLFLTSTNITHLFFPLFIRFLKMNCNVSLAF